ncbi:DDE_3 domain-containing protein [Trichonephila clavipes]|nr:DDE_3 domain-containing protein [Trichonephila clavipes]
MEELLDDWNMDVPSWKYPKNLESSRMSSPGFSNDFKMMFWGTMGAEFLFMDDNARPHRANIVDECLQSEDITSRQPPSTCLPELWRALLDEWCNVPQDQIDNLILRMSRRCKVSIASSGRHTPY